MQDQKTTHITQYDTIYWRYNFENTNNIFIIISHGKITCAREVSVTFFVHMRHVKESNVDLK